jgi:hypothetical protein
MICLLLSEGIPFLGFIGNLAWLAHFLEMCHDTLLRRGFYENTQKSVCEVELGPRGPTKPKEVFPRHLRVIRDHSEVGGGGLDDFPENSSPKIPNGCVKTRSGQSRTILKIFQTQT